MDRMRREAVARGWVIASESPARSAALTLARADIGREAESDAR